MSFRNRRTPPLSVARGRGAKVAQAPTKIRTRVYRKSENQFNQINALPTELTVIEFGSELLHNGTRCIFRSRSLLGVTEVLGFVIVRYAVLTALFIFHRRVRYCSSLFVTVPNCFF